MYWFILNLSLALQFIKYIDGHTLSKTKKKIKIKFLKDRGTHLVDFNLIRFDQINYNLYLL